MPDRVIENPILNSPYQEPNRHFVFDDDGITNEIAEGRRRSAYFIPIPRPRKQGARQLELATEWTLDRIRENHEINEIRGKVQLWRRRGYPDVTPTTRALLDFWNAPERDNPILFCQREAAETAIYLTEAAPKSGDAWIRNELEAANAEHNNALPRIALKMATGAGKTVVMAMLIAWHTLNKVTSSQDARFAKHFLVVTPGITIRDRLRVLLPEHPDNYYRLRDLVPADLYGSLHQARIVITNFHSFQLRETKEGRGIARLTKQLLAGAADAPSPFQETPDQMVARVCREFGAGRREIIVLNDEAHHCYRGKGNGYKSSDTEEALKGEDKAEAKARNAEARVWFTGLQHVRRKLGIKTIYDLSATPFFLAGSGYPEGTLFPWVVSDFSLIDAIESGIVKIPRVPVSDDRVASTVTYLELWGEIRNQLPRKGRRDVPLKGPPMLPTKLEGALWSLYGNYERAFQRWEQAGVAESGDTPPVFIVVCNNTNVSKLVFDFIAGWRREEAPDGLPILVGGALPLFSNVEDGHWTARPKTVLVDSQQLESGEAMSAEFKKIAAQEIEEFKAEYRERFPGRDVDALTDEDLLREVMNTIGRKDRLGERVRCVVSVSMLTEGWDANTVTHILGVRAFGTQLLCEQVVGRGLRRRSYAPNDRGFFEPEYAEIYGVPFSFIPASGSTPNPKPHSPDSSRLSDDPTSWSGTTRLRWSRPGARFKRQAWSDIWCRPRLCRGPAGWSCPTSRCTQTSARTPGWSLPKRTYRPRPRSRAWSGRPRSTPSATCAPNASRRSRSSSPGSYSTDACATGSRTRDPGCSRSLSTSPRPGCASVSSTTTTPSPACCSSPRPRTGPRRRSGTGSSTSRTTAKATHCRSCDPTTRSGPPPTWTSTLPSARFAPTRNAATSRTSSATAAGRTALRRSSRSCRRSRRT